MSDCLKHNKRNKRKEVVERYALLVILEKTRMLADIIARMMPLNQLGTIEFSLYSV